MTIIGLHVLDPNKAFIWADSEIFRGRSPFRHGNKLSISPLIPAAGVSTGGREVGRAGHHILADAATFEEAVDRIPDALMKAAQDISLSDDSGDPAQMTLCIFAVVGWEKRFNRLMGYTFRTPNYEPEAVRCFSSPTVPGLEHVHPNDSEDLTGFWIEQGASLQAMRPAMRGSPIAFATVTPQGITTRRFTGVLQPGIHASAPDAALRATFEEAMT